MGRRATPVTGAAVPILFLVDANRRLVLTTASGAVTVDDLHAHVTALRAVQALAYPELVDARLATGPWVSNAVIRRAAEAVQAMPATERLGARAVVVSSDLAYGIVRMFTLLVGGRVNANAFRDRQRAMIWLSAPDGEP